MLVRVFRRLQPVPGSDPGAAVPPPQVGLPDGPAGQLHPGHVGTPAPPHTPPAPAAGSGDVG